VSNFSLQSYDTATSSFDITEATEDFSVDGSNFANGNSTNLASDSNGNQTYDGTQVYTYDAWNRLITVSHGYRDGSNNLQHGQAAVTCSYDARGRRITKAVANTGNWDCTYNYYYSGNRQVEQQNGSAQTIKQFVWGLKYVDELIQTSLNSSPTSQSTCDTPYWAEQDANWNVLGIVNSSGVLTERYEYGAYGQRTPYISAGSSDPFCTAATTASRRFTVSGTVEPWALCEVGHQGLMHDEENGLVLNRARYFAPQAARFLQRDPCSYVEGLDIYQYARSSPVTLVDPTGLRSAPGVGQNGGATPPLDGPILGPIEGRGFGPGGNTGPYQAGWEWLWDSDDPTDLNFTGADPFTQGLEKGSGASQARADAMAAAAHACPPPGTAKLSGRTYYAPGFGGYLKDYFWNVPTGWLGLGNAEEAFVGGYVIDWDISEVNCCDHTANLHFHGYNVSGWSSATRLPFWRSVSLLGDTNIGVGRNRTQTFDWDEPITVGGGDSEPLPN
jgi:RHS repeat-associated protein